MEMLLYLVGAFILTIGLIGVAIVLISGFEWLRIFISTEFVYVKWYELVGLIVILSLIFSPSNTTKVINRKREINGKTSE